MQPELTIRTYSDDLLDEALALTRLTLGNCGAVEKSADFWRWKHHANPAGPSYGLVMWDAHRARAAGLRLLMRWTFEDGEGEPVHALRAVDTATHPDYRRQGIFASLTQKVIEELGRSDTRFIYNTPNGHSLPGYLKMGWRDLGKLPVYVRLLRPLALLRRLLRAGHGSPETRSPAADFLAWPDFYAHYHGEFCALLHQWESARVRVGLRSARSPAYCDWRFGQHPHVDYAVCLVEESGAQRAPQPAAFAVVRQKERNGLRELILADLCLARPEMELGLALLRKLVQSTQCDYLICHFASGTFEHRLIRRAGFLRVPYQGIQFAARRLGDDAQTRLPQTGKAGWDLCLADLEIF